MTNDNAKPDLTTCTIDELVSELADRSEAMVLALVTKADADAPVRLRFTGSRLSGRGLIADLADYATQPGGYEIDHAGNMTEDDE